MDNQYDILFILAGGLENSTVLKPWVINRLDTGVELFKTNNINYILCLGGGTNHKKSIIDDNGYNVFESTPMVQYLIKNGIDRKYLLREWSSYDTIGNAFFSLVNYAKLIKVKNIMIITSTFHIKRTQLIFDWIYGLDKENSYNIKYISCDDSNISPKIIESRKKREEESIKNTKLIIKKINTLEKLFHWFFFEHSCYNTDFNMCSNIDENEKNSY